MGSPTTPDRNLHMSSEDFRAAVEFLFGGYGAQRGFAREIGVHETSIRRYIQGREIPPTIVLLLAYMYERTKSGWLPALSDPDATIAELIREAGKAKAEAE